MEDQIVIGIIQQKIQKDCHRQPLLCDDRAHSFWIQIKWRTYQLARSIQCHTCLHFLAWATIRKMMIKQSAF